MKPDKLDELIEEITVDADGEAEQVWAFRQAFEDNIPVPCEAMAIGEPVRVMEFDWDGNERRGITATCRGADGAKYEVAAWELALAPRAPGGRYLAAYRKWMGLAPLRSGARRKAAAPAIVTGSVELVVLSAKQKAARCRVLGSDASVTIRTRHAWELVPGEIAVVKPAKQWIVGMGPHLSGKVESTRVDAQALGLVPLRLEQRGTWDPAEHYWGEEGDPIEAWAKPIIARGPRPEFEMEQILPLAGEDDPFDDPIGKALDVGESGDTAGEYNLLMDLCQADLRCLDAHAHLGNLAFDGPPERAIRHYEAGFRIGELSLGKDFDGLLPWGWIDNRPFLRSMHGFGLCLWRLRRLAEAEAIFRRMLWMNPTDNQGARELLYQVRAKRKWEDFQ